MKKFKISGKIVQPFSGIIEADCEEEVVLALNEPERINHFIYKGNLSVSGTHIEKEKLSRVPDNTVINYY